MIGGSCLGSSRNHIHLVLNDSQDRISKALQGALSSYSRRFNRRSGRVGHLFESRFGRYPIEDEAYLLETVRYVHANPQNAGLCLLESYPWSSYSEYIRYFDEGVISGYSSPSIVANIFGSKNRFVDYSIRLSPSERIVSYMGEESDAERLCSAEKIAARHGTSLAVVKGLRRPERDPVLIDLSEAGFTAREIERFTGVSKSTVARIVNIYRSVVEETGTIDRTPGSNSIT